MTVRKDRRQAVIELMADHVLYEGLGGATLRPLAAAAGTSDRMLLYYFVDKDELLAAVLDRVAERMLAEIEKGIPAGPRQLFSALLEQVWATLISSALRPFMLLWLELAGAAARGSQPHRDIAARIADAYLNWVASKLEMNLGGAPKASAQLFIVAIEGMYILSALGRDDVGEAAMRALVELSD